MERYRKLTLLHSNDMHGDFLAESVDEDLIGGVSMLSGYINKVRNEEEATLYCIAGDMFRGSVIDSEFKGTSTIEIMNAISPDIVTLGNHEVDYGIAHLLFLEKCARFPIINANLYIKSNHARLFNPYKIITLNGMKILFIGIITEGVMKRAKNDTVIGSFLDIHEAAKEVGRICNTHNAIDIDLTVLLTHIGFEEDKLLAAALDPAWGVDIIIGGHSHTFIEKPEIVNNIAIVQAGIGTNQIGRFDITVDTEKNCIHDYIWQTIPINDDNCPRDADIDRLLTSYKEVTDRKYNRTVTRLHRQLTHPSRYQETELGNLFTDILAESLGLDAVFMASGSIRTTALGPLVQYADLVECYPYDESVYMITVTGQQLKRMLKYVMRPDTWKGAHNGFFQISHRLRVTHNITSDTQVSVTFDGVPADDNKLYRIGMQKYHYNSFEKYFGFSSKEFTQFHPVKVVSTSAREIIEEYLTDHQMLDAHIDGRITLIR